MSVKIGFIGSGGIANIHMRGISNNTGFDVAAACDPYPGRAKAFAQQWGVLRHYIDMDKMLENEDLDAVLVCTPNYAHKDATIRALRAGIHVYCEKPMATNVAEAEAMVEAARQSKAVLTIGHHMRFKPECQFVARAREAGDLGDVHFCRAVWRRRGGVPWRGVFHIKEKSGGGALIDIGVHIIDLGLWLMGSPKPVEVVGSVYDSVAKKTDGSRPNQHPTMGLEFNVDDFAAAYVRMDNGATLAVECSWAANQGPQTVNNVDLFGDKGGASLSPPAIFGARCGEYADLFPQLPDTAGGLHAIATERFRQAVVGEAENLVKPEETLNVQKILDGIYQSATTGRAVVFA